MSDHQANPGPDPSDAAAKAQMEQEAAQAKQQAARTEADAKKAAQQAEAAEAKAAEADATPADEPEKQVEASKPKQPAKESTKETKAPAKASFTPKQKAVLDEDTRKALELRNEKNRRRPAFRRQEWFRYKKLGGKHAGWRQPRGMHSKARMHLKYRPNVASIGYRGPTAARGLHPSGFEEALVYRPEDLDGVDPKTHAARVGGTVGGRKAEQIEKRADELGIRVLNRRS